MSNHQLKALARRVARIEKRLLRSKQPTLSFSSVEDGAISVTDVDDNLVMLIGKQYDNTNTASVLVAPAPPTPSVPYVVPAIGGLRIYWDGTYEDGAVSPMDWTRVTIHVIPTAEFVDFDPLDQSHIYGAFTHATGGDMLIGLEGYDEHTVYFYAWNEAGTFSEPSQVAISSPRQVSGPDIEANSVTANNIETGYLEAGFVLSGMIQVGEQTWTPADGLRIPQPGGKQTHLPADGISPSVFSGQADFDSLHVQDNLTISGEGELTSGRLMLGEGVGNPTLPPLMSAAWPALGSNLSTIDEYWGLCEHPTDPDLWAIGVIGTSDSVYGRILLINKSDLSWAATFDPAIGKSWTSGFLPWGGIASYGDSFYVLGDAGALGTPNLKLYRINATTYEKTAEVVIGNLGSNIRISGDHPAVFVDHTSGPTFPICMIWSTGSETRRRTWSPDLSTGSASAGGIIHANLGSNYSWAGVVRDDQDADSDNRTYVCDSESLIDHRCYEGPLIGATYVPTRDFPQAEAHPLRGFARDSVTGSIWTYDQVGEFFQYGDSEIAVTLNASYTWYDGDNSVYPVGHPSAGIASGTHETEDSPTKTLALPPRAWGRIEGRTPPHIHVTDPDLVDKANRVGIYASLDGDPLKLQSLLPVLDGVSLMVNVPTTGGASPPATNGFVTADNAPGEIASTAERLDGNPKTTLDGTGAARVDGLLPPGAITMWGGAVASIPVNWLRCDGASYLVADFPDLFDAIGYTYGGSGANFSVPNFDGVFPRGEGTLAIGATGGSDTISSANLPPHTHGAGTLTADSTGSAHSHDIDRKAAAGSSTGVVRGNGTAETDGTTQNDGAHSHDVSGNTGDGGFANTPFVPEYLAIGFIIRT